MIKRILSIVLVLGMLVGVLPADMVSAEPAATKHTHSDAHRCSEQCPGSTVTWKAWGKTNGNNISLPTGSGHYYLEDDVTLPAPQNIAAGTDITICLNGYTIRSSSNKQVSLVYGKLTIADCTAFTDSEGNYVSGAVIGGNAGDGSVFSVRRNGGTLVLESGRLTDGKTTGNSGGGAIYAQGGTSAGAGGMVYMYGGEVSGNEGNHGGAIYLGGGSTRYTPSAFRMYGGKITNNTARSNGGGVYVADYSNVEIYSGIITGSTAGGNGSSVHLAGSNSKLTVSGSVQLDGVLFDNASNAGLKVNQLTDGTSIQIVPHADATNVIAIADGGKQESWNRNWVTVNGEQVSLVDGVLKVGHYHGTTKYEAWAGGNAHNALPTGSKNYYLTNDITRNADGTTGGGAITIASGTTQHMCLNGYTITHRKAAERLYNIQGNFFLEDCTAYTDDRGKYVSGGVTYGGTAKSTRTYGALFSIQRGGTMTMTGGQIYGLTSAADRSKDGAAVYVYGAQRTAKAVFNMQGGQIHSITSKADGAAIRMTKASTKPASENFSEVNISGGKIWGNTSTANGGAVAVTSDVLNITGGVIEGNTAETGAVYVGGNVKFSMSGNPVITKNNGGNLYLADSTTIDLGALDASAKIGVGASSVGCVITNAQATDVTKHFTSDDSEKKVSFRNNCVYLSAAHEHAIDGKAGDMGWSAWNYKDRLPTDSGSYYLVYDVELTGAVSMGEDKLLNLCLNGKTVTAKDGARIMSVGKGSVVTVTDCCENCGIITGGSPTGSGGYGGAFTVLRGGTLKLYNGKITGNSASHDGGAVYIQAANDAASGGALYMFGGEISGNTASNGGAVCVAGSGVAENQSAFVMYGGTITDNTAATGGAVYGYENANITLQGGKITGNTATGTGGGLYISQKLGKLEVLGSPVVEDNKAGVQHSNIHLTGQQTIVVGELQAGAKLMVTADAADRAVTDQVEQAEADRFCSDSAYRVLSYKDNKVYLERSGEHVHCNCFDKAAQCQHREVKWQAWESTTSLPTASGCYYLLADVALTNRATVPAGADIKLCLNGRTVTAPKNNRILLVQSTGQLTITDCIGSGKLTGGNNTFGGAMNINRRATVNLYGGTVTGNRSQTDEGLGGAVYLQAGVTNEAGGSFNMYGGALTGNTGFNGGAVCAANGEVADATPAQINIYAGTITGNTAVGSGGAIYAGKYSTLNITGGTFSGNTTANYGGVIYADTGSITASGGSFTENTSGKDGAALYIVGSTVNVTGGNFAGNVSKGGAGGAMGFSSGQVTICGGVFSDNVAAHGGAAIIRGGADLTIQGGTFSNNRATKTGGAFYVKGSQSKFTGGTISDNVSGKNGAGVYCYAGEAEIGGDVKIINNTSADGAGGGLGFTKACKARLTGGTVTGNTASNAGGIIVQGKAYLTMTGGYVGNNTATNSGGGVFVNQSTVDFIGGTIAGNTSGKSGAGLFANASNTNFSGTVVTGNEAAANGGAMYINKGKATFTGGTYSNNSSKSYGGGLYFRNAEVTMRTAKVLDNYAKAGSGGMYGFGGKVIMEKNVLFSGNKTDSAGGGICVTRFCDLIMNGTTVEKSEANNGGGMLIRNWAKAMLNDVIIRENISSDGSGLYVSSNVVVTMNGGQVTGNISQTKLNKSGEEVGGNAAGVYLHTNISTVSGASTLHLNNVQITNNVAEKIGGGVYVDKQMVLHMDGCTVQNNRADGFGAGIYQASGTSLTVKNTKILANSGTATGSALYAGSDLVLTGCTITGNKTGSGTAVYVAPARYDGHSYANAVIKLGGDMQIVGNEGTMEGDLYFDEGVAAAGTAEGFGKNTRIKIQLHSGVLTDAVLAAYNYEGGNQVYTITYGDRSLTEPAYVKTADSAEPDGQAAENALLHAIIGVIVLASLAVFVLLLLRRKKTRDTAAEASKE